MILFNLYPKTLSIQEQLGYGYCHKCTQVLFYIAWEFCPVVTELQISRQISVKSFSVNFHENACSESRIVQCGKTQTVQI